MGLPSGTVTFLFTDIERSTQTVGEIGDERYAELQDAHRKLLREAFEANGGVEVGTEGDAFFVAFTRAHDAVAAALDGQRALDAHPLRVRMGLHTGEALVRENDYVGHDVHKAKRISDAGHGGQVLVSQTTADLVRDALQLTDLGPHRLKDLGEPQRIFQVRAEGVQADFPPLRSLESFAHNLPQQRTSFVGREKEIAEVSEILQHERMVTLVGVGGCGKTRLAVQVGAELLDGYSGGVFFVDLAPLSDPDPDLVTRAIAGAVGLPMTAEVGMGVGSTEDRLLEVLSSRKGLVILDNCEHLLDACADVADRILESCPEVTILATSREPLDVEGEQSWRIPSLSVPEGTSAQASEAVSLFDARARAVRTDFRLTPDNVDAVSAICRRLDGIPLAIEFAASRISHLSAHEISEKLGDMFQLLAGGRRRRVQRQQTLQAALDWSYDLLSDAEQALLRRLAVFAGTFKVEAVEGICAADPVDARDVLDLIGSLVAKSLVVVEEVDGRTRYRLIETVRQYAAEKLREAGEADVFRVRHRDWYLDWARSMPFRAGLMIQGADPEVPPERANLFLALERCEDDGRLDLAFSIATKLAWFWQNHGLYEEGLRWLTRADPADFDIPNEVRVGGLAMAGRLAMYSQRVDAQQFLDRALELADEDVSYELFVVHLYSATLQSVASRFARDPALAEAARDGSRKALQIASDLEEMAVIAALASAAEIEFTLGDVNAAHDALERAAIQLQQIDPEHRPRTDPRTGQEWFDSSWLPFGFRLTAKHLVGELEEGGVLAREALAMRERMLLNQDAHSRVFFADVVAIPAVGIAGAGDVAEAHSLLVDRIEDARKGRPGALANLMIGLGAVAFMAGDLPAASKLLAWVRANTIEKGKVVTHPCIFAIYEHYVRRVREALPAEEARRYRAAGAAMSEDEAMACATEVGSGP